MGALLSYSLVSGLFMFALYLAYRLFMARENQHSFNRCVLLLIYLISFAMPGFISIAENFKVDSPAALGVINNIDIGAAGVVATTPPLWGTVSIWVYIIGMVAVAVKTVYTWIMLSNVVRKGEKIKHQDYTLVVTDSEKYAPFSWVRYIVISRADYENKCGAITAHELKHIKSRHWIDLVIAQIVCVVDWFNPVTWLMRDELILVHEYQADMAVINSGNNPQEYQMLLIKKAVGSRFPSLANSLNHSKLKKRITMMYKSKSGAGRKLKALALVPMLTLAICMVSIPAVRAAVSTISSSTISADKGSENSSKINVAVYKVTSISNDGTTTIVVVKGTDVGNNITVNGGTFTNAGKVFYENSMSTTLTNGTATITTGFPFVGELKNASMTLKINGEEIPFDLSEYKDTESAAKGFTGSYTPGTAKEVKPQYPGGEKTMLQAIMNELKYTEAPKKAGASGCAVIKFTVNANGQTQDFEVMRSSGYGDLDAEAIRAIKEGLKERWIPGTVNGKPVSVSYCIPITFTLK